MGRTAYCIQWPWSPTCEPLLDCLDFIEANEKNIWDPQTVTEGTGLNKQLQSSNFIVAFLICHCIVGSSKRLARQLQGTSLDITTAFEMVDLITVMSWKKIRTDDVAEFSKLYEDCVKMAEDAEEPVSKPRVVGCQTLRSNVETESRTVLPEIHIPAIPWPSDLSVEDRFSGRSQDAIKALYLLPKNLGKLEDDTVEKILSWPSFFHWF